MVVQSSDIYILKPYLPASWYIAHVYMLLWDGEWIASLS